MIYKSIIIFIVSYFLMLSVTFVVAQEEHTPIEAVPVTGGGKQVPQSIITKANEYIISIVGQSYLNQYFESIGSSAYSVDKDGSSYSVLYKYLIPAVDGAVRAQEIIVRLDSKGDIVSYRGPTKPYKFLIDKEQALSIARKNGMYNPTNAEIVWGGQGFQSDSGLITESYMWNVFSDVAEEGTPYVIYIDVDSGNIIGKLTQGSTEIRIAEQSREFTPVGKVIPITSKSRFYTYLYIGVILLLILIFVIYFLLKKKRQF